MLLYYMMAILYSNNSSNGDENRYFGKEFFDLIRVLAGSYSGVVP